jgi:hypothetical protein
MAELKKLCFNFHCSKHVKKVKITVPKCIGMDITTDTGHNHAKVCNYVYCTDIDVEIMSFGKITRSS